LPNLKNSSSVIGTGEIAEIICAFERTNRCRIEVTLCTQAFRDGLDLRAEAVAWSEANAHGVRLRLVSANVRCSAERLVTLEAVITNLLYALDFKLAEREFERTKKPSA
jgi:hypothetical protein